MNVFFSWNTGINFNYQRCVLSLPRHHGCARSPQQALDIYDSGMKYLRAHRLLARLSSRQGSEFKYNDHMGWIWWKQTTYVWTLSPVNMWGMDFSFGTASQSSMLFGCIYVLAYSSFFVQWWAWLRLFTISWKTAEEHVTWFNFWVRVDSFLLKSVCMCIAFLVYLRSCSMRNHAWKCVCVCMCILEFEALIGDSSTISMKRIKWSGRNVTWFCHHRFFCWSLVCHSASMI